jgi:hypothetical protein
LLWRGLFASSLVLNQHRKKRSEYKKSRGNHPIARADMDIRIGKGREKDPRGHAAETQGSENNEESTRRDQVKICFGPCQQKQDRWQEKDERRDETKDQTKKEECTEAAES